MSFRNIKGQDLPIKILQETFRHVGLEGSYLFSGPQGIGKKLIARTLAQALNCLEEDPDSCGQCASCRKIERNEHPDVYLIDHNFPVDPDLEDNGDSPADSTAVRIKHIRQLQREIALRPYEGEKKVFVIDNAHKLTADAANCFLKTLEEPPQDSLIILVTAQPNLLFKTIVSRCKTLRFCALARSQLEEILIRDYALDEDAAHFLAYFCEGRIGYALKLKESDFLSQRDKVIEEFIFKRQPDFNYLSRKDIEKLRSYLDILAGWFRDIYFLKMGLPAEEMINFDRKEQILGLLARYSVSRLQEIFYLLSDASLYLEQNANVKLLFSHLSWNLKVA